MPLPRPALIAFVTANMFCLSIAPAFAILVPLRTPSQVPFSSEYPESAREEIRNALTVGNSGFIDGATTMRQTTLNFTGDTTAINEMLLKLSKCPAVIVSVSFRKIDHECDWQLIYTTADNTFRAFVNLHSEQIELEDLKIPSSKGPELTPQLLPTPIQTGG